MLAIQLQSYRSMTSEKPKRHDSRKSSVLKIQSTQTRLPLGPVTNCAATSQFSNYLKRLRAP
ncbi:hypothetical protein C4J89_1581 [Pseudomonas sp. R4-35-07]|nr:hypothetical protein C4J90_1517 [Pseudomonas sp. R2-60-08W]AZF31070.1 hypothetical protein C4J89_1581 [Pseudomonas sp. R4-35-07]